MPVIQKLSIVVGAVALTMLVLSVLTFFSFAVDVNKPTTVKTLPASLPVSTKEDSPPTPLPSHEELLRQLQAEANRQHVFWQVWCTAYYEGDKEEYAGIATKGYLFKIKEEEGASPYWRVFGYKTADGAAFALLQVLRQPPNAQPIPGSQTRKRISCDAHMGGTPQESRP